MMRYITTLSLFFFLSTIVQAQISEKFSLELLGGEINSYEVSGATPIIGLSLKPDVLEDAKAMIRFDNADGAQAMLYTAYRANKSTSNFYMRTFSPEGDIIFQPNSINRAFIDGSNGYLGLGTTSPQQRLHVYGQARIGINNTNYTEVGHVNGHSYINAVGAGDLELRHDGVSRARVTNGGQLLIGDVEPREGYSILAENGLLTTEVKVALQNSADWSDDEFENTPSILQVKESIEKKSHLYGMPSANELVESGIDVTEMFSKLLREIEWLNMHVIEIHEQNIDLRQEIEELKLRDEVNKN